MRIAVTGGTGFVGTPLVAALAARGHEVVAAARHPLKTAMPGRVRFVAFNMFRDDPVAAFGVPDALVHLAWPGLPNYQDLFHVEDNLPASYRLVKAMVEAGTQRVLVTGTCLEYGMQEGSLSEAMPTWPATPYGLAKDSLRKHLQALQAARPFALQWLRLFYLHGPGQNAKSVLAQLDAAIDRGDPVFNMSGGEQLRDYLPVGQAARIIASLLENAAVTGIVNCCSGEPVTIRALVERHLATRRASIRLNLGYYPYPEYEPMAFWGNPAKLKQAVPAF